MLEKMIKQDKEENLKIFKGMEKQFLFSKYGEELNQIFSDKSFNTFYTNLLSSFHRKINKNFSDDENENSKNKKNNFQTGKFDIESYKHYIKNLKKEIEIKKKKEKNIKKN